MKAELQALFVRRIGEEMKDQKLLPNDLVRLAKQKELPLSQPTISRILAKKQDPTLEKVEALADCLGVPAWFLLTEADQIEQKVIRSPSHNVVRLSSPYPRVFPKPEEKERVVKTRAKKRSR